MLEHCLIWLFDCINPLFFVKKKISNILFFPVFVFVFLVYVLLSANFKCLSGLPHVIFMLLSIVAQCNGKYII